MLKESAETRQRIEDFIFDKNLPCLTALSYQGGVIKGWLNLLLKKNERRLAVNCSLSDGTLQQIKDRQYAVIDLTVVSSLTFISNQSSLIHKLWGSVAVVPTTMRELNYQKLQAQSGGDSGMFAGWDLNNNRLTLYEKDAAEKSNWVELCDETLSLVDNNQLIELESIPAHEIDDHENVKILELMDVTTRDTILACYGYKDRFLVTDDPHLEAFAKRFNIVTVSSLQLMQHRMLADHFSRDEFSKHFVALNSGLFLSEVIPTYVLAWLLKQNEKREYLEYLCDQLLPYPMREYQNIRIMSVLIALYLRDKDNKIGAEVVLGKLINGMTDNGSHIVTIVRFLRFLHAYLMDDSEKAQALVLRLTNFKTPCGLSTKAAVDYVFSLGNKLSMTDPEAFYHLKLLPEMAKNADA